MNRLVVHTSLYRHCNPSNAVENYGFYDLVFWLLCEALGGASPLRHADHGPVSFLSEYPLHAIRFEARHALSPTGLNTHLTHKEPARAPYNLGDRLAIVRPGYPLE